MTPDDWHRGQPLRVTSRADAAYEALREAVVTSALAPGAVLRESELAERLGISRTPVREALRRLAEGGLVQLEVARGYRVAPLDLDRLRSVVTVYGELVGMAARLAVPRLTDDDLDLLIATGGDLMETYRTARDWSAERPGYWSRLLDLLVARVDDGVVSAAVESYRPHVLRLVNLTWHTLEPAPVTQWTGAVVAALRAREADLLGVSVRTYVVQVGHLLVDVLEDAQGRPAGPA